MLSLGKLPGSVSSVANAVSGDGESVVGQSVWSAGPFEAFRWTSSGGMTGLGYLPGHTGSNALGISADGTTVVGISSSPTPGLSEAFRWTESGGMLGIGVIAGAETARSAARATSVDGSIIVGYSDTSLGLWEAFRWTQDGGMVGLGDLPGGTFESLAFGVSGDGSVVVGRGRTATGLSAFVWDPVNGIRELKTVLEALGIDLTGWRLTAATAISTDGRAIVGYGTNPDGDVEGWIAMIPEPATGGLFGMGLVVLAWLRRHT
jgi:probable HAF family extracellular repeat protein